MSSCTRELWTLLQCGFLLGIAFVGVKLVWPKQPPCEEGGASRYGYPDDPD